MDNIAVALDSGFFGTGNHFLSQLTGTGGLIGLIVANSIVVAGIVFVILTIYGGISMINGAGSGNPQLVGKGKDIIVAALIGFLIVIAAYWIVGIIGRSTGFNYILG